MTEPKRSLPRWLMTALLLVCMFSSILPGQAKATSVTPKWLNLQFQNTDGTILTEHGLVKYLGCNGTEGYDELRYPLEADIIDGEVAIPLEPGKIYKLQVANDNPYYLPEGTTTSKDGVMELFVYVSQSGIEPLNGRTFDRLMEDPQFALVINQLPYNYNALEKLFANYLPQSIMINPPTTEEAFTALIKECVESLPTLPVATLGPDSYQIAIPFSQHPLLSRLQIVAVDAANKPIAGITCAAVGTTSATDGVVFDTDDFMYDIIESREKFFELDVSGTAASYMRQVADPTKEYPTDHYKLLFYKLPDHLELVTPENFDSLCKNPQFIADAKVMGGSAAVRNSLISYPNLKQSKNQIRLPFTKFNPMQLNFQAIDDSKAPVRGIEWNFTKYSSTGAASSGTTGADGMIRVTVPTPGMWFVYPNGYDIDYIATDEAMRNSETSYRIYFWVSADGTVTPVDDTALKQLCQDQNFMNWMAAENRYDLATQGMKLSYSLLKSQLSVRGDYTLTQENGNYLLPFHKRVPADLHNLSLHGVKDQISFRVPGYGTFTVTYTCPETGTYKVRYSDGYREEVYFGEQGQTGQKLQRGQAETVQLTAGVTYVFNGKLTRSYTEKFTVYVEKALDVDPQTDPHTAAFIKEGDKYSNMVSYSYGTETESLILARYPGSTGSWTFHVAIPAGVDYNNDLKIRYLPGSANTYGAMSFEEIANSGILSDPNLRELNGTWAPTPDPGNTNHAYYSLQMPGSIPGVQIGDLIAITYTGTVNRSAWFGSLSDSNMTFGLWSVVDHSGVTEVYDSIMPVDRAPNPTYMVDPAICPVFGIKIYKYSNYDRMTAASKPDFDDGVLYQQHLLKGAEFKLEGENLSKIIVLRDDMVSLEDKPVAARARAAGGKVVVDDELLLKLLYYRYEQGLQQDLRKVTVAQTQAYYPLKEDDLYTPEAPKPDTLQFYADNGQGYRLKPQAFTARGGDTIKAGDGGGLLLGGLGVGEYTLTEVKAPAGYAKVPPIHISFRWAQETSSYPYYRELAEGEVPTRDGTWGVVCLVDNHLTPVMAMSGAIWYPSDYLFGGDEYESLYNPVCYVLVNPIGNDRISLAAVKEVTDPADQNKQFTLKFTIRNPDGSICTKVKYAVLGADGQYTTQPAVIDRAENWSYAFRPGQKIAFLNLLEGSTYEVIEENGAASQYVVSYENANGTIQYNKDRYPTATVINSTNKPVGSLTVSKLVDGSAGDMNKAWNFTVTLAGNINGTYGEMTFQNGVAKFRLAHGDSLTAEKLPAGMAYTVKEAEANGDGYVTYATGDTGTITQNTDMKAQFRNHKDGKAGVPQTGDRSHFAAWMALMTLSAVGLGLTLFFSKKQSRKEL